MSSAIENLVNKRKQVLIDAYKTANDISEEITEITLSKIPYKRGMIFRKTINDKEIDYLLSDIKVSSDGTATLIGCKRKINGEFGKRESYICSVIYDSYALPEHISFIGNEPLH